MQVFLSARITSTSLPASRGDSFPVIFSSSALGRFFAWANVQHSSILNPLRHSWQLTSSRNWSILMFQSHVSRSSTRYMIFSGCLRYFTRKPWIIDIANLPSGRSSAKAFARSGRWQKRRTILSIWYRLASPISKASSVLPGRRRAGSSLSLKLVVMMIIRPSWLRTPSMALRKPEKVRELVLPVFLRSLKMESTSSSRMIDFLGAEFSREFRWKSLMLSEQFRKQMENLTSPAKACANELLPVPGGPYRRQLRLQGMPMETYHSSLSMNSRMSARISSTKLSWKMTDSSFRGRFSLEMRQQPWLFSQMIILLLSQRVSARPKMYVMNSRTSSNVGPYTRTRLRCQILRHSVVILASPRQKTTSRACSLQLAGQVPSCGSNSTECFFNLLPIDMGGITLRQRRASSGATHPSSMRHFTKTQQESSSLSISTQELMFISHVGRRYQQSKILTISD